MRASWAETWPHHPDPGLRPRVYEAGFEDVFRVCVRAAEELSSLELAEADPRRGVVEAWVKLLPLAGLPLLGPRKHPRERGRGWVHRLDARLAKGWLQARVDALDKGKVQVSGHVRLELPMARPLAGLLLKNYLRWVDIRSGAPRKP